MQLPIDTEIAAKLNRRIGETFGLEAEAMQAILLIRQELDRLRHLGVDNYSSPLVMLPSAQDCRGRAPWPLIEAARAPSLAIVDAAELLGLPVSHWTADDAANRTIAARIFGADNALGVAFLVASAGHACARMEYEVKLFVHGSQKRALHECWPYGCGAARDRLASLLRLQEEGVTIEG